MLFPRASRRRQASDTRSNAYKIAGQKNPSVPYLGRALAIECLRLPANPADRSDSEGEKRDKRKQPERGGQMQHANPNACDECKDSEKRSRAP